MVRFALHKTAVLYMRFCAHSVMDLDVICNLLTLELHIAIAQNRYGTHSCATLHTSMHYMQSKSHHVNSLINILYLKNCS